jgi:hypothetical protein
LQHRFLRRQELFHPLDAGASDRLGFRPGKRPGPHGSRYKAGTLVELATGAVPDY